MARKAATLTPIKNASRITQATEPQPGAPAAPPARDRVTPTGIGLRESQVAELDRIAAENGLARNAVLVIAVRRFLDDYRAGRVNLDDYFEVTTIRKLRK
jgi:hypothetical protein